MVIAGPGTGKTTILTLRIANILRKTDTPPSGILAITFTESGVKAMRIKLREIIGNRADEVRIHTFHGFAASVINEFKDHFVHLERTTQITEIESESIIRALLEQKEFHDLRPYGNPDFYVQKIISSISDCKREALTPEMVTAYAKDKIQKIKSDDDSYSTRGKTKGELKAEFVKQIEKCERTFVFSGIYSAYENKKKEERKIDFDDLISELLIALRKDELLLRILQEKFLYILVDEHQDTNNSQNELITKLADFFDTPNVFIVGDEKQAIYRFQGASVENFLKFQNTWKDMKIIQLTDNYRSHQNILDASFSMIENNYVDDQYEDLRVKLTASGDEKPNPIEIVSAGNHEAMVATLVENIKKIIEAKPESSVAIITKTNRDLESILKICESNNIKVSSERSIDIFNHPIGNLFFDLIEFIYDPSRTDFFSKTLISGLWNVNFSDSINVIKNLRSGKNHDIEKIPAIIKIRHELSKDGPINFLINLAELSGLQVLVAREPAYVEVWRGIVTLSENLIKEGEIYDPKELLKRLLAYRASSEMKSVKISIGTPDLPVKAMTAHGSKGLEFDYVYIPFANEESWIGRNWGEYFVLPKATNKNEIEDVRRLFYVALTRAKKHVTILYSDEENGKNLLPLRFIDELPESNTSRTIIPRKAEKAVPLKNENKISAESQKILDYTKHTLISNGLSVTALNHFLNCQSAFIYQSILKLPQAPAASSEKGNAMHLAFSNVWSLKDKSTKNIEKTIEDTLNFYFEQSLLPSFEKDAVRKELLEDLPIIVSELYGHFNQGGTILSETWSESKFFTNFEGQKIEIPIHGKLDAIVDNQEEVYVYDYKTKQAMSENEILGKTKNSNGDYFRQLVFYKKLLSDDSRFRDKNIIPALVFVVPDSKKKCKTISLPINEEDASRLDTEITSLIGAVWSGEILTSRCEDDKCEWCKLKNLLI
jgi:DNA helicase-2/ATP-dependent DNA helicase PcrA